MMRVHGHGTGFTLLGMSIALMLAMTITLGTLKLAQAASFSARLQQNLAAIHDNTRFAIESMGAEITQGGYHPEPWASNSFEPFVGTVNNHSDQGDRLAIRRWSDHNCFGNRNPAKNPAGKSLFYLRFSVFEITSKGQLALTCEYGPDEAGLVRQVNRMGLIEHVHSMQILFALDTTGDGNADRWSPYGHWDEATTVIGIRAGLLLLSPGLYSIGEVRQISMLDETRVEIPGNRLHRLVETSWPLLGRVQS